MSRRAAPAALFALFLLSYGWFHQGGGWNQNVRFAQVRALVHDGTFAIDDQLLWAPDAFGGYAPVRLSDETSRSQRLPRAVSLDLSSHAGAFYPNKPPGLQLLAVPGYALFGTAELRGGDAWGLELALYLTTLLSVGLLSALGALAFHDVARRLFPDARPGSHLAATLAYGLATPVFAYATFLIDHAVVASLSLFALRSLLIAREEPGPEPLLLAGLIAGLAVLTNNSAAFTAIGLGVYVLATFAPPLRSAALYAAGGALPALVLGAYHQLCFGSPFDLPQHHQLGVFQNEAPLLGVFGTPRLDLLPKLLFMPYRGLFFWSPVLAAGAIALLLWRRKEALLFAGLALAYLLMNASFNAWHGGGTFGPRYLVPAIPFLALPLVLAFERARAATTALAVVSFGLALGVTAVSPQLDAAEHRPLTDFYLPLLRGETLDSGHYRLEGPVSVHPTGFAASGLETMRGGERARWASFNLGEALFPQSLWSLAPLLALQAALVAWLRRRLT